MHDSYENPPADSGPWAARHPGRAGHGQYQHGLAGSGQPATPPDGTRVPPPDWAGHAPGQDPPMEPPEPSGAAGPNPGGWAAQDPYLDHPPGHPAGLPARGTSPHYPTLPGQSPYPTRTMPPWQATPPWQAAWAGYDPYFGHHHPAYAARNDGLRRLSKLTWRAVEISTVAAAGLVVLVARNAQGATSHVVAAKPSATPSVHAAAIHQAHTRHKPKRRHSHHHRSPAAPALAPPSAAPAPPPPPPAPPPAAPPPPAAASGGSGGG